MTVVQAWDLSFCSVCFCDVFCRGEVRDVCFFDVLFRAEVSIVCLFDVFYRGVVRNVWLMFFTGQR